MRPRNSATCVPWTSVLLALSLLPGRQLVEQNVHLSQTARKTRKTVNSRTRSRRFVALLERVARRIKDDDVFQCTGRCAFDDVCDGLVVGGQGIATDYPIGGRAELPFSFLPDAFQPGGGLLLRQRRDYGRVATMAKRRTVVLKQLEATRFVAPIERPMKLVDRHGPIEFNESFRLLDGKRECHALENLRLCKAAVVAAGSEPALHRPVAKRTFDQKVVVRCDHGDCFEPVDENPPELNVFRDA